VILSTILLFLDHGIRLVLSRMVRIRRAKKAEKQNQVCTHSMSQMKSDHSPLGTLHDILHVHVLYLVHELTFQVNLFVSESLSVIDLGTLIR